MTPSFAILAAVMLTEDVDATATVPLDKKIKEIVGIAWLRWHSQHTIVCAAVISKASILLTNYLRLFQQLLLLDLLHLASQCSHGHTSKLFLIKHMKHYVLDTHVNIKTKF